MVDRGWLSSEEVFDALVAAGDACGLNQDDGEGLTRKTIQSGLESGRSSRIGICRLDLARCPVNHGRRLMKPPTPGW
jgi:hypothetical protein